MLNRFFVIFALAACISAGARAELLRRSSAYLNWGEPNLEPSAPFGAALGRKHIRYALKIDRSPNGETRLDIRFWLLAFSPKISR